MISSPAIIVSIRDTGEAHRTYTVYTRDYGKVDALATGIKKPKSKFAGHMTEVSVIDCTFHAGRERARLIHATRIRDYPALRSDLTRYGVAHAACEVVDVMTERDSPDAAIFFLLARLFTRLDEHTVAPKLLLYAFLEHFLAHMGLAKRGSLQHGQSISSLLEDHLHALPLSIVFLQSLDTKASL
jgi:DNA repair protein RecO (recombination protein O)